MDDNVFERWNEFLKEQDVLGSRDPSQTEDALKRIFDIIGQSSESLLYAIKELETLEQNTSKSWEIANSYYSLSHIKSRGKEALQCLYDFQDLVRES